MVAPKKKGWKFVQRKLFWVLEQSLGGFEVLGLIELFVGPVVLEHYAEMWREWVCDACRAASPVSDRTPTVR